ncbi:hypothetical protein BS50DRAFT_348581 [Corynespora cassiicola Philippines]|uniref:Secreted protein n=1 Tax=Corynespora cassiicola Philippines TaxID=1448308 RepID=A0A2T2NQW8_CORCC|nr:hypothetical protein BS50DRAFT_348581 [Corynespora cassiicola Philippines]
MIVSIAAAAIILPRTVTVLLPPPPQIMKHWTSGYDFEGMRFAPCLVVDVAPKPWIRIVCPKRVRRCEYPSVRTDIPYSVLIYSLLLDILSLSSCYSVFSNFAFFFDQRP